MGSTLDLSDLLSIKSKASAALIGPQAQGLFGSPADIFLVGAAADWNHASGLNRGSATASKYVMQGGATVDDLTTNVWPPVATITCDILTSQPLLVNQAIDIRLGTDVYLSGATVEVASDKAGIFSANPVELAEGTDGAIVSYTPTAGGVHTLSFAPSDGHSAPAPLQLTVEGSAAATQTRVHFRTLEVPSIPANDSLEHTFTVPGLTTADTVFVNKPSLTAGVVVGNAKVPAPDTLAVTFGNLTGAAIDPQAESYTIVAVRA